MYQRVNQEFLENVLKCNALVVRGQAVHHSYQAQVFIITEFKSLNKYSTFSEDATKDVRGMCHIYSKLL